MRLDNKSGRRKSAINREELRRRFLDIYPSSREIIIVRAPGRINLIGEHTDYNKGLVLPVALDREIIAIGSLGRGSEMALYSENFKTFSRFSWEGKIERDSQAPWANYPRGVIYLLREKGIKLKGLNLFYWGDLPLGGGLSSSAAIEIATAFLLNEYLGLDLAALEMIKLCQQAENEFVGVNCGIMDQFIVRLAEKGKAIFLNCRDLSYEQVPFPGQKIRVMVCNTMVKRNLKASNYNRRREECQEAVKVLGEIDGANFERYQDKLTPILRKRARHVISENERVKKAVTYFKSMDFSSLGECLYESHRSLRDDYEVSCPELDLMVGLARGVKGTWGSRMTGAGFGGCTVNLVSLESVNKFREEVSRGYQKKTGCVPEIYTSSVEGGMSRLE